MHQFFFFWRFSQVSNININIAPPLFHISLAQIRCVGNWVTVPFLMDGSHLNYCFHPMNPINAKCYLIYKYVDGINFISFLSEKNYRLIISFNFSNVILLLKFHAQFITFIRWQHFCQKKHLRNKCQAEQLLKWALKKI